MTPVEQAVKNMQTDPVYFQCDRLRAWMRKAVCVARQEQVEEARGHNSASERGPNDTLIRFNQCDHCPQGREIRKEMQKMTEQAGVYEVKPPPKPAKPKTKTCSKCGKTKPLEEFDRDKKNQTDGRSYQCSQCRREYQRALMERRRLRASAKHLPPARHFAAPAAAPQPPPEIGKDPVLPFVMLDLARRADMGKQKYATMLKTHNGRDALTDAYQEALDLCMYLRQAILERDGI